MRWALHTKEPASGDALKAALESARDAFLLTNPYPTRELEKLEAALAASEGAVRDALVKARADHVAQNEHPDMPDVVAQMNRAIAAAVLLAGKSQVHASCSGELLTGTVTATVSAPEG